MYDPKRQKILLAAFATALLMLTGRFLADYFVLGLRPNPFDHAEAGVPALSESPWHPMQDVDEAKLPWVLDSVEAWSDAERALAEEPCGLLEVLRRRYPVWYPEEARGVNISRVCGDLDTPEARRRALREAGVLTRPLNRGTMLLLTDRGEVILERTGRYELALTGAQGLVYRRQR